jgi:long-subunit fatty acid transport protein
MKRKQTLRIPIPVCLVVGLSVASAAAAQGHRATAAGARGYGLAGVGVALGGSPLEALRLNPALLAGAGAVEISIASESEEGSLSSEVGPFSGTTADDTEDDLTPAFAWSGQQAGGGRISWGIGAYEAGGFGVDYHQQADNPVLAPQPFGFGAFYTQYEVMHVPVALAYQVSPAFSFGVAAKLGQATFGASPAGFATPDCTSALGPCYFPDVDEDRQTAVGWQAGVLWGSERFAVGASYSVGEEYDFEWNSAVANPGVPTFGTNRQIAHTIAEPDVTTVGVVYRPTARLAIAVDGQQIAYEDAEGFGSGTGAPGFADVTVMGVAVEMMLSQAVTLRVGATQADSPIEQERAFFAIGSPLVIEDRLAAGLSWRFGLGELDVAYVVGDESELSGAFISPAGAPIPGTSVGFDRSSETLSVGFRYRPRG